MADQTVERLKRQVAQQALAAGHTPDEVNAALANVGKGAIHSGDVLQGVAPIAALAIPGLGPLASAAIAAGGSAAGQALNGQRVNIGRDLALGAGVGGARAALGATPTAGRSPINLGSVGNGLLSSVLQHPELIPAAISAIHGAQAGGEADALRRNAVNNLANINVPPVDMSNYTNPSNPYAGRAPINTAQQAARASLVR